MQRNAEKIKFLCGKISFSTEFKQKKKRGRNINSLVIQYYDFWLLARIYYLGSQPERSTVVSKARITLTSSNLQFGRSKLILRQCLITPYPCLEN